MWYHKSVRADIKCIADIPGNRLPLNSKEHPIKEKTTTLAELFCFCSPRQTGEATCLACTRKMVESWRQSHISQKIILVLPTEHSFEQNCDSYYYINIKKLAMLIVNIIVIHFLSIKGSIIVVGRHARHVIHFSLYALRFPLFLQMVF